MKNIDKKTGKKTIKNTIFIIIALMISFYFIFSIGNDRDKITKIINKKYNLYEIKDISLEYIDWSSTVSDAEAKGHKATQATVIIANEEEQMTIRLKKTFNLWFITNANYDYGNNVANDIYFVEETWSNLGKAIDIENHIKLNNLWIIPDKDGNLYTKSGNGDNWYYSYKYYKNIYKTQNGYVYVFDKENSDWKKSDEKYSDMLYYSNYTKIDKEEAVAILKKYSSYVDN